LISFIRDALIDLEGLFRDKAPTDARQELARLAETSVTYIRRTIVARLREVSYQEKTDYLQFFVEACRDEDVTEIDLFTLNHDTLIEDFLRKELIHDPITITDGLRDIESDKSRRWDYRVYDEPHHNSKLVKVFKLHGTFKCAVWDVTFGPGNCAIVPDCTDRYGRFIGHYTTEPPRNGPVSGSLFLAGTFNKILKYNSSMFLELHHRFYRALDDQDCRDLVVCGYGFGDKGINTRIVEWRRRSVERRLLIIDPAESTAIHWKARGSIQNEIEAILNPQETSCLGPVKHLKKGIGPAPGDTNMEIATWEEVRRRLNGDNIEFLK
jgi:hypothetical protein